MLDCYLMTICGDKAASMAMRASAIYNWARKHSVLWNQVVCADENTLLIAVLNDVTMEKADLMLNS